MDECEIVLPLVDAFDATNSTLADAFDATNSTRAHETCDAYGTIRS
jgi:hypothetical protein